MEQTNLVVNEAGEQEMPAVRTRRKPRRSRVPQLQVLRALAEMVVGTEYGQVTGRAAPMGVLTAFLAEMDGDL